MNLTRAIRKRLAKLRKLIGLIEERISEPPMPLPLSNLARLIVDLDLLKEDALGILDQLANGGLKRGPGPRCLPDEPSEN